MKRNPYLNKEVKDLHLTTRQDFTKIRRDSINTLSITNPMAIYTKSLNPCKILSGGKVPCE